jgi:penicillin-binding protein 2
MHRKNRFLVFYALLIMVYAYLQGGLFWRQIIQHREFFAKEQRQNHRRVIISAPRGNIYARNGELLAGNKTQFSLVAYISGLQGQFWAEYRHRIRRLRENNLPVVASEERSQARLAVLRRHLESVEMWINHPISLECKTLDHHHSQKILLPLVLIENLSLEDLAKIIEFLPPDGPLQVETGTTRFYPHASTAAHVIGYASPTTDIKADDLAGKNFKTFAERSTLGRAGVEASMDETLRGINGGSIWIVDSAGRQIRRVFHRDVSRGKDVTLSIDIGLQKIAEEALAGEVGCAILSDVQTGEILAMASAPAFNPNDLTPRISQDIYRAITAKGAWLNQCIQGLYPPGSIFKLVSTEVLLRHNIVDRQTEHFCDGHTSVGNRIIRCNNHCERGRLPIVLAIAKSCNSMPIDLILGNIPLQKFIREIRDFGFGERTGIELPYEMRRSLVPTPDWKKKHGYSRWTDGDTANLAIGQGYLLVTPLQINLFTASLAGRRSRTTPTIFHGTNGNTPMTASPLGLSDDAYETLLDGMRGCVEYGSGRRCKIDGLSIAAKTGTAQTHQGGKNSHLAWITAFAPAGRGETPRVAVTVMLCEPFDGKEYGGGREAAPVARKILQSYFQPPL